MLSNFTCTCWPSVVPLWPHVCSVPLLLLSYINSLYILTINPLSAIYVYKYFLPFSRLPRKFCFTLLRLIREIMRAKFLFIVSLNWKSLKHVYFKPLDLAYPGVSTCMHLPMHTHSRGSWCLNSQLGALELVISWNRGVLKLEERAAAVGPAVFATSLQYFMFLSFVPSPLAGNFYL